MHSMIFIYVLIITFILFESMDLDDILLNLVYADEYGLLRL